MPVTYLSAVEKTVEIYRIQHHVYVGVRKDDAGSGAAHLQQDRNELLSRRLVQAASNLRAAGKADDVYILRRQVIGVRPFDKDRLIEVLRQNVLEEFRD